MTRLMTLLSMLVLMTISVYCQDTYPKKIIFQEDTLVAITTDQLVSINIKLNQRDLLVKDNITLKKQKQLSDSLVVEMGEKIVVLHKSVDLLNLKSESQQNLIESYKQEIDRKTRQNRKRNLGVGIGGFTLGLLFGVIIF